MNFDIILKVFLKWRKIFYKFLVLSIIISIVVTFLIPRKYRIKAVLMPYQTQIRGEITPAEYMKIFQNMPKGFASFITPADILAAFAQNGNVISPVIKKFNLVDTFKVKDLEDAVMKLLKELYSVNTTEENFVELTLLYPNPETGKKILNEIINELDKFVRNIHISFYNKREKLIKERFEEIERELKIVEDSLKDIKEKYNIHNLEEEYSKLVSSYINLKKEEIEAEINFKTILSVIKDTNNIEVKRAKKKWKELHRKVKEIEKGGKPSGFGAGFGIPLQKVPELSLTMKRLWRKQKTFSEIYTLLLDELEKTRIEASKNIPFFTVISKPGYSKRDKVPKRSIVLLGGIFLSLFFSIILIYIFEFIDRIEKDEKFKILKEFFKQLGSDFKKSKT